jgi:hypothetical protein
MAFSFLLPITAPTPDAEHAAEHVVELPQPGHLDKLAQELA